MGKSSEAKRLRNNELQRLRYAKNPEKGRALSAARRAMPGQKEVYAKLNADWYQNNKSERAAARRSRYSTDAQFRAREIVASKLRHLFRGRRESATAWMLMGCSVATAVAHIESQFAPWMTWENWGRWERDRDTWHIDHIAPLVNFDLTTPEGVAAACHYTNLCPRHAVANLKKGARPLTASLHT